MQERKPKLNYKAREIVHPSKGKPEPPQVTFSFSVALEWLKKHAGTGRVAREGWNGKGMWIALQRPDGLGKMTLPYLYMSTVTGDLVPWLASQTDLLAEDWTLVA